MSERLTDAFARRAEATGQTQTFFWDTETKGFGLRVTAKGAKAFLLDYRTGGRQRRITIGRYPDWSVAAARAEAREMKRSVDRGDDPMGERHEDRMAPSMTDLWTRYRDEHLSMKSPRSQADQTSMWEKLILPSLGYKKVADVSASDISALHRAITQERGTPVRANRTVEVLRKAFNLAIVWKLRTENPASGVARNREDQRHRYLTPVEMSRLFTALDDHPEKVSANAIRFLALTGARKSEVLAARWDMFDLSAGIWTKPAAFTKQRRLHRVPLSAAALTVLNEMKWHHAGPYVFPGRSPDSHLTDVKRSWESICANAGLCTSVPKVRRNGKAIQTPEGHPVMVSKPNARIHDLRHSFASLLASGGRSLPLIGALLGHTQTQTTMRYAHLYDDAVRRKRSRLLRKVQETRGKVDRYQRGIAPKRSRLMRSASRMAA